MSNKIPTDVLLEYAGSDYDDLPADVQKMCDEAEADLKAHGIDVDADLAATEEQEAPSAAPTSVTVTRDKKAPESFASRTAARTYASAHGLKVVDNGAGSDNRWTVSAKGGATATPTTGVRKKAKSKKTATATATPSAKGRSDTKAVAIQVYRELESAGTLKRSTFLSEMESRVGQSAKGASSYFYRIKGGTW